MKIPVSLIVAADNNGIIGNKGALPWPPIKGELAFFRQTTIGHSVIMGRKTWESLPTRPLSGRDNIVLSADRDFKHPAAYTAHSVKEALGAARLCAEMMSQITLHKTEPQIFIIGGASVFTQFLPLADRVYLSRIIGQYIGDCYFRPDLCAWKETECAPEITAGGDLPAVKFYRYDKVGDLN